VAGGPKGKYLDVAVGSIAEHNGQAVARAKQVVLKVGKKTEAPRREDR
jgi:hypothetical protein